MENPVDPLDAKLRIPRPTPEECSRIMSRRLAETDQQQVRQSAQELEHHRAAAEVAERRLSYLTEPPPIWPF